MIIIDDCGGDTVHGYNRRRIDERCAMGGGGDF